MKKKVRAVSLILAGILLFAQSIFAATYLSGTSSVDGKVIAWGGKTTYSSACSSAMSTWNALKKISITPDTIWTIEDMTYKDTSYKIYSWYGAWEYNSSGADKLWMNTYNSASLSSGQLQSVCTHELGHALGLAHSIINNVMYAYSWDTALGSQDKSDYSYLYP